MTFRILRDDTGQLLGAKCCHCPIVLNARSETALSQAKAAHRCPPRPRGEI